MNTIEGIWVFSFLTILAKHVCMGLKLQVALSVFKTYFHVLDAFDISCLSAFKHYITSAYFCWL